jgi:hypothetical protein
MSRLVAGNVASGFVVEGDELNRLDAGMIDQLGADRS